MWFINIEQDLAFLLWRDELAHELHVVVETVAVHERLVRVAAVRYEADSSIDGLVKDPKSAAMIAASLFV